MAENRKVIIDAGHGGQEPGAVYEGRQEKEDALQLAFDVGNALERRGISVSYTRVSDVYDSPYEKAAMANASDADIFLSIHRNAMPVPKTASGAMTLVYEDAGTPALLAENIQRNLTEAGFADLGIKERPGLIVLRRTLMPAVLVEAGFIDSPEDNRFFDQNFQAVAQAVAEGILTTIRQMEVGGPEYYQVQVGAFRTRMPAERLLKELQNQGFPAFLVYSGGLYKVRVGAFLDMENGIRMERQVRGQGYPTVLVREPAVY